MIRYDPPRFHEEKIICPECGLVQMASVEEMIPFNAYVHECEECRYIITESEWEKVDG